MAKFANFIGGSYQAAASQADAERSLNLYPEKVQSPGGQDKAAYVLLSRPGLAVFTQFAGASAVRAECELNGRAFAIAQAGPSSTFYEVLKNGTSVSYGALPGDRRPQLTPSETQILVLCGGIGYVFDLAASTLTRIDTEASGPAFPVGATKSGVLDGYGIVLEPNSQTFAISADNDFTAWDGLDFGDAEGEPGNVVTFIVDHRQVWFFCNNHTEVYYDAGNANFPLVRLDGAFMEQGSDSIDGAFQCDNTVFWLGGNRDGRGICWRANGYTPERVSTHAIEALIQSFGDASDVSGYAYQETGHTFARWDFPSANGGLGASILFDIASGFWHERCFWNATMGFEMADLARCHMFAFGKHLVGDWRSGTIYEQSLAYTSDAGAAIRRLRAAPDLANGGKFTKYGELRLLADVGVGLDGGGISAPSAAGTLLNAAGLVTNNVALQPGRGAYFAAGSGTSESQFLLLLGALNAYQASANPQALTLAQRILAAVPLLYRDGAPGLIVPATVDATHIFAPHWLFACQTPLQSATIHYSNTAVFTAGVATIPDAVAAVRYVFQVASVGYTLVYPNPYSPLATGTSYPVASYTYNAATATTTITLATAFTGTLAVLFSALDGPEIAVNELYEAWPDWRPLAQGEIDAACDTFNWALRAFLAAQAVTGLPLYAQAASATATQAAIVYDIDDSRDWLKPNYQLEPFAQSGSYSYTSMTPAPVFQCDAAGDVEIVVAAGTAAGQTQYGIAAINDVYAAGNTTEVWAGASIAMSVECYIDTTAQTPYVDANRYFATLALSGAAVQLFTLNAASFVNHAGTALPANAAVYTFGFQDSVTTAHTLTLERVRQLPDLTIPYLAGAIPFTANFLGTPSTLIGWRGPCYTGYQSPSTFKRLLNETGAATNVQFLHDAQAAWTAQAATHDVGPFAPVFIFDRADAVQYGAPNTWAWNGPDPNTGWTGYQYRPLAELAECVAQCVGTESYYAQAVTVANNFLTWTNTFWANAITGPPTEFPVTGAVNTYYEIHVPALILRAVLFMASKFGMTATYTSLMTKVQTFWASQYQTAGAMAGTFCANLAVDGVFGFQTGEILRTLAQWQTWALANAQPAMAAQAATWSAGLVAYALDAGAVGGGQGVDPQIVLQTSDDGGRTWGMERAASLGKLGEYRKLVRWRRNGRSNNRAFRVICTEAVRVALIACDLDSER